MKKPLLTVLLVFISNISFAFDKEAFCRSNIKSDTSRAEWGIKMRNEMFSKCKGNIDVCAKPYLKRINDQEEKDKLDAIEIFNRQNYPQAERLFLLTMISSMTTSALMGFKYEGKTANQIALENYSFCLK